MLEVYGPYKNSHQLAAAAVPAATVQPSPNTGRVSFRISVQGTGTDLVAVGWGYTAAEALANAVFPTAGSPRQCLVFARGAVETIAFTGAPYFAAISASAADVYIAAGSGI